MKRYVGPDDTAIAVSAQRDSSGIDRYAVTLGDERIGVTARSTPDGQILITSDAGDQFRATVSRDGAKMWVTVNNRTLVVESASSGSGAAEAHGGSLEAPMPGKVLGVHVKPGDKVSAGDTLLIMEAMKMEHPIVAPHDGIVKAVNATEGSMVNPGTPLVLLEKGDE